jgi:hypothetical protein
MEMTPAKQQALRAPFPTEHIQKLPVGGAQLDYVSHGWVTDRLLEVDPSWTWQPLAFDLDGLPKFDDNGGLWIELTVCGVTRLGYGEPQGRDKFDQTKGAIGNAIRVAAMRFGVGLDLWAREAPGAVVQPKAAPVKPATKATKISSKVDNTDRINAAFVSVMAAQDKNELRDIWAANADLIDVPHNDSTLRQFIMLRQEEMA